MKAIVPISLKRIAVKHMQEGSFGRLTGKQEELIKFHLSDGVPRDDLARYMTIYCDKKTTKSYHFFRLL